MHVCPTCGQEVVGNRVVCVRFEDMPTFDRAIALFYEDPELKEYGIDTADGMSLLMSYEAMSILRKKEEMKFSVDGETPNMTEEEPQNGIS